MSKRKCDIAVGQRAYAELMRLFPNYSSYKLGALCGCERKTITAWRDGESPSAIFLIRMHYLGADILWILTGERSATHKQTM